MRRLIVVVSSHLHIQLGNSNTQRDFAKGSNYKYAVMPLIVENHA